MNNGKIKSIKFNVTLSGKGIVQTDSKEQKYLYNKCKDITIAKNENNTFAKANFYKNNEGEISRKVKISSDGLRHAIHIDGHNIHVQNVDNDKMWVDFIASVDSFLRGYMKPIGEKKKSVYSISSAEISNNAIPFMDVHSKSGERDENSLFFRENIGDTVYNAEGFININELRFISTCDVYNRRAVKDDDVEKFIKTFSENLGSVVPNEGYFNVKNSSYKIPERGIVLSDDNCKILVKSLFTKIANIMICKSCGGFAKTDKIEIQLFDSYDSEPNHITIYEKGKYNWAFLDSIAFNNNYEESSFEVYSESMKEIDDTKEQKNNIRTKKSEDKKNAKKKLNNETVED